MNYKLQKRMGTMIGLAILLLAQNAFITAANATTGTITNNSNNPINVVFYINYTAPTQGSGNSLGRSAQGRFGAQGTLISGGQNYNFPAQNITSIDVFYGNGTLPPLHATVNTNASYTINQGAQWSITQD